MPEKGVMGLYKREIDWEAQLKSPSRISKDDDEEFFGDFVTHPACCSRVQGCRQTFTIHVASPSDPHFIPLPVTRPQAVKKAKAKKSKKTKATVNPFHCKFCYSSPEEPEDGSEQLDGAPVELQTPKLTASVASNVSSSSSSLPDSQKGPEFLAIPAAEYVNSLNIRGRLHAIHRGKEMVLAICNSKSCQNFLLRVNFAREAHCLWIKTDWYRKIVSLDPVQRGEKSNAYRIPADYLVGTPTESSLVSIQAAFICPEWTLIFVDHNVMITFHLMQASPLLTIKDLIPSSPIWLSLWSRTHGPVYSLEPEATVQALSVWRQQIISKQDYTPIFLSMKNHQEAFNGSGAQEATDQLQQALISPLTPAVYICTHDALWKRFFDIVITYDADRLNLGNKDNNLPYVSGLNPFCMNYDGHKRYLKHISCYRRNKVFLDAAQLKAAHELGLFNPNATIQPDGRAIVIPNTPSIWTSTCMPQAVPTQMRADRNQARVMVPNYMVHIAGGNKGTTLYTPFTAQGGEGWPLVTEFSRVETDVKDVVNQTTLGLYSFRLFVDSTWSVHRLNGKPIPVGRRPLITAGNSHRKRPASEQILRTAIAKKPRVNMVKGDEENIDCLIINIVILEFFYIYDLSSV
ncbi:hypothetical protein C8J57DRAFT_1466352 [Mycena rebaudengoi]|nr:hypothetical protein C8J57DRAFT_1466352 [Mycena rebaudengoi]